MAANVNALRASCIAALSLLGACAGAGAARDEAAYPQSVVAGGVRLDALPAQELAPGRCGLYLWAQNMQQPLFILVAYNTPAEAHVRVNGRDRVLPRTAFHGEARSGHFEEQTFSAQGVSISLDLTFADDRPMRDGVAIRQGVMRIRDAEDWETITPVGGLLACAS